MITFEGVSHRFGDTTALAGIDLTLADHELCILLGPSGSGKSTLLRLVNRLLEPTSGRVLVDGQDVRAYRPEALRRTIGYVIQNVGLFPHWKVRDNVATVPRLLGWDRARIRGRVEEVLDLVGLPDQTYGSRYPHELSGGEAQRVGVARALASDPPILLMDEPFSAVDPLGRHRIQGEFLEIQRRLKKTVVFVTHDVDEAVRLGDRIALLNGGRLVQYDRTEVLLESPSEAFVGDFLGQDRTLKRLSRVAASTLARSHAPSGGYGSGVALAEDLDLRMVLSHFLESGTDVVALKNRQDRITGWLHREDLEDWARIGELVR